MRKRETRRRVMVRARLRDSRGWRDTCILNMSSYGMMCQAASPPSRGEVFELRRGIHIVVGRVVWSSDHRFGVRTQEQVPMDAIVAEPSTAATTLNDDAPLFDRRRAQRPAAVTYAQSRWWGQGFERMAMLVAVIAGVALIGDGFATAVAQPMARVDAVLDPR